ncbi:MAG: MoaD/ThiS family protein [Dehalococcoidales bacterium]|nr:MoaD/ThiS family protein [Dehalococcoidales bacterium]
MSVNVEISSVFGRYTGGVLNMKVEGKTVRECLHDLVRPYPDLKRMLLNKDGNLMHSYDFFINGESVYPKDMNLPLKDGDKLNVVYVIHGG